MNKEEFKKLSNAWAKDTGYMSTTYHILKHENVKKFKEAGIEILPFIIEELEKSSVNSVAWSFVLEEITGCKPIPKHHWGYAKLQSQDWIVFYHQIYLKTYED